MLIEFPKTEKYWGLPLTSNLKDAIHQTKTDRSACHMSTEPYRRRNAIIVGTNPILRKLLVEEAFQGTRLLILDWKGRLFSRETVDALVLGVLSKQERADLRTVCIFDPELMDPQQMQSIAYCLENAPMSTSFVFLTATPKTVSHFVEPTSVIFDTTELNVSDEYKSSAIKFFNCVFRDETRFELDKEGAERISIEIAQQPPDFVANLAFALSYAQLDILAPNQFRLVENWFVPAFEAAIARIKKARSFNF